MNIYAGVYEISDLKYLNMGTCLFLQTAQQAWRMKYSEIIAQNMENK